MKIVMAVSGGMDSATLLAQALNFGHEVIPVTFQYGSKHNAYEYKAATALLDHYQHTEETKDNLLPMVFVDLTGVGMLLSSKLLSGQGDIPEGHYEEESMRQTVVPGRNLIFASVLAGIAWSNQASEVWVGVHAGDHFIYPDCRPDFVEAMNRAICLGTEYKVALSAPYLTINKAEILKKGLLMEVPYGMTRTCYKDQRIACGKCGSCQERLWAFDQNKTADPLDYVTRELMPKKSA